MSDTKKRWQYRFDNFKRAHALLREAVKRYDNGEPDELRKTGTIRVYNRCRHLAWKTLKDYLTGAGITLPIFTPKTVVRKALTVGLITDGETWMEAVKTQDETDGDDGTLLTPDKLEAALKTINKIHHHCFTPLTQKLQKQYGNL